MLQNNGLKHGKEQVMTSIISKLAFGSIPGIIYLKPDPENPKSVTNFSNNFKDNYEEITGISLKSYGNDNRFLVAPETEPLVKSLVKTLRNRTDRPYPEMYKILEENAGMVIDTRA